MQSQLRLDRGGKFLFAGLVLWCLAGCGGGSSQQPTGPTISAVAISPTSISLQVGQSQQFTAKVTGTGNFDSSVQWFVNEISGGNDSYGTIVGGLYKSPAQAPSPATVTIKARSTQDSTKSASAPITIRPVLMPTIVWNETRLSQPGGDDGEVFDTEIPPGIAVADDGAGGAFVFWEHSFPVEILAQHLDANGQPTWAAGGILVTDPWTGYQAAPRAVSDGAGGAIVVWIDGRAGFCDPSLLADCDIYGQRMNTAGTRLWGAAGKPIATAPNTQGVDGMAIISDAAGGALVGFTDARASQGETVYVQRVNGNGDPVWATDGIRLGESPNANDTPTANRFKFISDGAGGAIGAWYFTSYVAPATISIRSQRVSASGELLWGTEPVSVPGLTASDPSGTGNQTFDITTDGSGGALFLASWQASTATIPSIFAQRIDSSGKVAWSQSGMSVSASANSSLNPATLADGSGGLFAVWQDCPNIGADCDIVMQHLSASGQPTWGQGQIYISKMPNQQLGPAMQPDGNGGAFVSWADCRAYSDANSCYADSDVYAQDVDPSGNMLWQANGHPLLTDPGNQGEQYYVYVPAPPVVSIRLPSGDILMAWPDGRDHTCFTVSPSTACELFIARWKL